MSYIDDMERDDLRATRGTVGHLRRLDRYERMAIRLFPDLSEGYHADRPSYADAFILELFLECFSGKVALLDVGPLSGRTALYFAGHPKVESFVGTGPNPEIPGTGVRDLDIAQMVLAEAGEQEKVRLHEREGGDVPVLESPEGGVLLTFVDNLRTREGMRADLEAVFGKNPGAVAVLAGCRHETGPFVQAGVVDFMERARRGFRLRLFGDLSPGLATSGLGVVFPDDEREVAEEALAALGDLYTRRLDPLRLLAREEELIQLVKEFKDELDRTRERLSEAHEKVCKLEAENARYSSRRYRLADALAEGALRAPGVREILRRLPPSGGGKA